MARLILLNGLPASGKSTLARRYAEQHPLMLVLDIDVVRGLLGAWIEQPDQSGVLARRLATEMARAHLDGGRDVIVPQYLGRLEFVLTLAHLSAELSVDFIELALLNTAQDAAQRFERRSAVSDRPEHQHAASLQRRSGGRGEFEAMHSCLLEVVTARPATHFIETVEGEVDDTYARLLEILAC